MTMTPEQIVSRIILPGCRAITAAFGVIGTHGVITGEVHVVVLTVTIPMLIVALEPLFRHLLEKDRDDG